MRFPFCAGAATRPQQSPRPQARAPLSNPCRPSLPRADEPKEIKSLYRRFRRLDRSGRGTISTEDLTMIPELFMNPLAKRLCAMFERDEADRINFRNFARGLSVLGERASPETKLRALFRIYDVDGDGYITEADVREVLLAATGRAMEEVVRDTIASVDKDGDGRVSLEDFRAARVAPWESYNVPVSRAARDNYFLLEREREEGRASIF